MSAHLTLGATWRRLTDLGYAPTSATHPDRLVNHFRLGARDSFLVLADHPAAIMTYPRLSNGASVEDGEQREVVALILTAYLLADPKQSKAVQSVLADYGLLSGPVRQDDFGNQLRPLKWSGRPLFDGDYSARLCYDADDFTVLFKHAIAPERYEMRKDQYGTSRRMAVGVVGTHVIPLDGEWRNGSLLDTPREKLPELIGNDLAQLISDCELARWDNRPAVQKEVA